jgi:hypothetical protein
MEEGTTHYLCTFAPLLYLLSDLLPPPPFQCTLYSIYRQCVTVLKCTVDLLQEFYTLFLTRLRTYKIASPHLTKMTSKDDIKGSVSLKFLRPWFSSKSKCVLIILRFSCQVNVFVNCQLLVTKLKRNITNNHY